MMASHSEYKAIYLSGAGVANSSYGLPDLGMTTLDNVLEDVRRITSAVDIPLLVDIDTGWGNHLMIERSIKSMIQAGAAAVHIEDQPFAKRCGHRKGKSVVSKEEMVERLHAAVEARGCGSKLVIMARTDAFAIEGMKGTIERALAYVDAGADMIFAEAFTSLAEYAELKQAIKVPILANITEFGQTPLFTLQELSSVGVDMALYPLSANRAMNLAALHSLQEIRHQGTQ
jgi:methylisocitrate lyase